MSDELVPVKKKKRNRNRLGVSTRCSATSKRSGEQCQNWALIGAKTCRFHGSSTKASRARAEERILAAVDPAAAKLVWLMHNGSEAIQFAAAKDLLNRAGLGREQAITVQIKRWEQDIEGILVDLPDKPEDDIVDGEVVEDQRQIPPSDWEPSADPDPDPGPKYPRGRRYRT